MPGVAYKYDGKNRVGETDYFGDDGTPQVLLDLGAAIVRQEYDDQGNIAHIEYFDGLGQPSASVPCGAPAIRIKVEDGTTSVYLRDAADKPMRNPVHGYASFSYKTGQDQPLSLTNHYFDLDGRPMGQLRVDIINPHLHKLETTPVMRVSARCGALAAGLGALLASLLALRKTIHTRSGRVYAPTRVERFFGWFAVFAILEGDAPLSYHGLLVVGRLRERADGPRGLRSRRDFHRVFSFPALADAGDDAGAQYRPGGDRAAHPRFLARARLEVKWDEARKMFVAEGIGVGLHYSRQKCHAYLKFREVDRPDLVRGLAEYIRAQAGAIKSPPSTRTIALYYPSVALCYFLYSCTAFYTLWQLIKGP